MKNKKATASAILAALAAASMAGCPGQSPEPAVSAKAIQVNPPEHAKTDNSGNDTEPTESRTVIVGTTGTDESYFVVDDQGNWMGTEVDLWAEIEVRTGWTTEMKQVSDMAFLSGELSTGRVDVAANCFAITEARLKTYIASDSIYADAQVTIVRPDGGYKTLDDLRGHTIGVIAGQVARSTVENMAPDHDWEIVTYEGSGAGFQDCSLRHIDCYASTVINIEKAEKAWNLELRTLNQKLFGNNVGWWFADTEKGAGLRDDTNVVLKEMHEDGTVSEIITKWFYEDLSRLISDEWLTAIHQTTVENLQLRGNNRWLQ